MRTKRIPNWEKYQKMTIRMRMFTALKYAGFAFIVIAVLCILCVTGHGDYISEIGSVNETWSINTYIGYVVLSISLALVGFGLVNAGSYMSSLAESWLNRFENRWN